MSGDPRYIIVRRVGELVPPTAMRLFVLDVYDGNVIHACNTIRAAREYCDFLLGELATIKVKEEQ